MRYRVLVYDEDLGKRVFAYGPDRRELRFRTQIDAADAISPLVGDGKRWPCLYSIDPAPPGEPPLVPCAEPRRFRKLERRSINT